MNNEQLVREYQEVKNKIAKLEENKLKAQTELDIKNKELSKILDQLKELGITDLDKINEIVEQKRKAFEDKLNELKGQLDNVSRA